MYLISFDYDYYCQGYEKARHTLLVKADTFFEACKKISDTKSYDYRNARAFVNETIE